MAFPFLPTFIRNDALGPSAHNNLLQRQDWLYDVLAVDHDPVTGEHNTPHVARTLGCVRWGGASYSLEGFNADVSLQAGHNPSVGVIILTLATGRYMHQLGVVEVQAADENGSTTPWVATAEFTDDTHLMIRLFESVGGVSQGGVASDGDVFVSIRSPRVALSTSRPTGAPRRLRGDGLAVGAADWNPMIQAMGSNRTALLANHSSAGLHDCREVSRAWAAVRWDDTASQYVVMAHQGLEAGIVRLATGAVRLNLVGAAPAMVAPVQAFVSPVSTAIDAQVGEGGVFGSANTGLALAMVPRDSCAPSSVDVYLYQSNRDVPFLHASATTYEWSPGDGDFFVRVHSA